MNNDIFIFGTKETAECAAYDIKKYEKNFRLCGFIEDEPAISLKFDLPVYSTENFLKLNLQNKVYLFLPISKNRAREKLYLRFKELGFKFYTFVSPLANVSDNVSIGENSYIQEYNNIQFGCTVGNNCIFWASNHIGHHGTIGDSVFLSSKICISGRCTVGNRVFIGSSSTIRDGLKLCDQTIVGMGSSLIVNTYKEGVYVGNPAKLKVKTKIERFI